MRQQVNLYNAQLRSVRDLLSFRMLAAGIGGVVFIAMLGYAWYGYRAGGHDRQSRELDARLQALRDESLALSGTIAERGKNAALEDRLRLLEAHAAHLDKMQASLDQVTGGSPAMLSEFLRAFARQSMEGVWLTGISIGGGGNELRIDGRALNPDLVPAYIARLNNEPMLQGRRFSQFAVMQSTGETSPPAGGSRRSADPPPPAFPFHEFRLVSSVADDKQAEAKAR